MEIVAANPVLAVQDLQASAEWYRQSSSCLGRCPDTPSASEIGDHSYVAYLEVADIQAYYARAKNARVPKSARI